VEELAESLLKTERIKTLVFYGGAENAVQKKHRNNKLHEACDDYSLTDGSTYKFSSREYLYALSKSKYGLCLAGYGPKCNREIECMAVGTVPVVAPDVDMTNYVNPPEEGVHYIRLKGFDPDEARSVTKLPEDSWKKMSEAAHKWWKENSSMEGLFLNTIRECHQL
jgi:glycosyltransferase involved in cell wall biosynthesis